jgi:hypothetical protein
MARRKQRTGACPDSEVAAVLDQLDKDLAAAKTDPDQDRTWASDLREGEEFGADTIVVFFVPRERSQRRARAGLCVVFRTARDDQVQWQTSARRLR